MGEQLHNLAHQLESSVRGFNLGTRKELATRSGNSDREDLDNGDNRDVDDDGKAVPALSPPTDPRDKSGRSLAKSPKAGARS